MQQATSRIRDLLIGLLGVIVLNSKYLGGFSAASIQKIISDLFMPKVSHVLAMFYFDGWRAADSMKKGPVHISGFVRLSFTRCNKSPTCHLPTFMSFFSQVA